MPVDPNLDKGVVEALGEEDTPVQDAPAPTEDTPDAPSGPVIDWEKRHRDAAAKITELAQRDAERQAELDRYREQVEALQSQSYTPPSRNDWDDDDDDYVDTRPAVDPLADPRVQAALQKVEELAARQEELDTRERVAAEHAYIDSSLDAIEEQYGVTLSDRASTWIGREALANRDPITGNPDVEGAYAAFHAEMEEQKKAWVSTKPDSVAPVSGPGAIEVPDLDDQEAHAEWIDQRVEEWNRQNG